MSFQKVAAGFVVFKRVGGSLQYLLLKASYPPFHWTPPKGHTDEGESEIDAAYRETEEEAGLTRDDLEVYHDCKDVLFYEAHGKPKKVVYWLAELKTNKEVTISKEHIDLVWADRGKAMELIGFPTTSAVIRKFDDFLLSNKC